MKALAITIAILATPIQAQSIEYCQGIGTLASTVAGLREDGEPLYAVIEAAQTSGADQAAIDFAIAMSADLYSSSINQGQAYFKYYQECMNVMEAN